jgi:hypothetical protein
LPDSRLENKNQAVSGLSRAKGAVVEEDYENDLFEDEVSAIKSPKKA